MYGKKWNLDLVLSLSLFKGGDSFCFFVYFISKKIRGRIKRKFTLLRIIMYGKKWNLDLVFSLSLFKVVVLSVFWLILSRERFEGGLEKNLLDSVTNYYVWKEVELVKKN